MQKNKQQLFSDIDYHLSFDKKPSDFINSLYDKGSLKDYPFLMLCEMKDAEQSPVHHPEGNVWNHTMLVVDLAAENKAKSSDPHAFMWAALLHDIGKPKTTKKHKGKITSYNHDKIGAELVHKFMDGFFDEDFIGKVSALVRWHMQILFVVKDLPFADIVTMKQQVNVMDVSLLGKCDRLGRLNPDSEREKENIRIFLNKCNRY